MLTLLSTLSLLASCLSVPWPASMATAPVASSLSLPVSALKGSVSVSAASTSVHILVGADFDLVSANVISPTTARESFSRRRGCVWWNLLLS